SHVSDPADGTAGLRAGVPTATWRRTLRWRINRLRCMTPAELPYRAARLIAAHMERIAPLRQSIPPTDQEPWTKRWVNVPEGIDRSRSEEHTSELQSHLNLVCRLLLEKKKKPHSYDIKHTSNMMHCRRNVESSA